MTWLGIETRIFITWRTLYHKPRRGSSFSSIIMKSNVANHLYWNPVSLDIHQTENMQCSWVVKHFLQWRKQFMETALICNINLQHNKVQCKAGCKVYCNTSQTAHLHFCSLPGSQDQFSNIYSYSNTQTHTQTRHVRS